MGNRQLVLFQERPGNLAANPGFENETGFWEFKAGTWIEKPSGGATDWVFQLEPRAYDGAGGPEVAVGIDNARLQRGYFTRLDEDPGGGVDFEYDGAGCDEEP